jgi:hypothetical protein
MAKKPWKQLETNEKLEALREDIAQAFNILNRLISDVGNSYQHLNRIEIRLSEVATAVEALERQLPKAKKGRKK